MPRKKRTSNDIPLQQYLNEKFGDLDKRLQTGLSGVNNEIAKIRIEMENHYVTSQHFEDVIKPIAKQQQEFKDLQKWVMRFIIGAVLAAVLSLVFVSSRG